MNGAAIVTREECVFSVGSNRPDRATGRVRIHFDAAIVLSGKQCPVRVPSGRSHRRIAKYSVVLQI